MITVSAVARNTPPAHRLANTGPRTPAIDNLIILVRIAGVSRQLVDRAVTDLQGCVGRSLRLKLRYVHTHS